MKTIVIALGGNALQEANRPATAEAELLSYIDLLDSRMEIYAETIETLEPGRFSERIFSLEKKIYHHGLKDPEGIVNET